MTTGFNICFCMCKFNIAAQNFSTKRSDYFTEKIFYREKKSIALYSCTHTLCGVYS